MKSRARGRKGHKEKEHDEIDERKRMLERWK